MDNGVHQAAGAPRRSRAMVRGVIDAVLGVESTLAQRVLSTLPQAPSSLLAENAFGQAVAFDHASDARLLVARAIERASEGERVALVATADALASARGELRTAAQRRLPLVAHVLGEEGNEGPFAFGDLGWAVLLASGVEESVDLSLVARRATEDSGTPFLVFHERSSGRHVEPVSLPDASFVEAFVNAADLRVRKIHDAAHPGHVRVSDRAFSDRVPFALSSAMRGLEGFTGRRHDVLERAPAEGGAVMLVGAGVVGDALLGEAERLRAAGHDVGALKLTALRPFPGARVIRALGRALVVSVLESWDEPLSQSNPLIREVKAAFADALTWAPGYPGIGRLPRIHSGVVGGRHHELDAADLDAIVDNMVQGEQGKRLFVMGQDSELALARRENAHPYPAGRLAMRGLVLDASTANACAELCSTVLFSTLALKCKVTVRAAKEGEAAFDLVAGRDRARGVSVLLAPRVIAVQDRRFLVEGDQLALVASGGVVGIPTEQATEGAFASELPAHTKALLFDRGVRVVGFSSRRRGETQEPSESDRRWLTASAFAGLLLFGFGSEARASVDGSLVEREVASSLRALHVPDPLAHEGGLTARRVFEDHLEVGRATVEGDLTAIGLGRRDVRGGV